MRPNFKNINIRTDAFTHSGHAELQNNNADWITPELIPVKPIYTKSDLEGMEHLNYVAGIPPYLRGPYSGMSLDDTSIRRLLYGRRIKCFLSPQSGFRTKRIVGGIRPSYA